MPSTNCITICIASVRTICPSREGGFREKEARANDGRGQSGRLSNELNERRNRTRPVCRASSQTSTTRTGRPSIRSTCCLARLRRTHNGRDFITWPRRDLRSLPRYGATRTKTQLFWSRSRVSRRLILFCKITKHETQWSGFRGKNQIL